MNSNELGAEQETSRHTVDLQQVECTAIKKRALVTGSGSGIGANIAIDLAKAGYLVVVTGRNVDKLNRVVRQCNEVSGSSEAVAFPFVADLISYCDMDKLIDFVELKFKRLDLLVNNACFRGGDIDIFKDKDADEDLALVMRTNVTVPLYLIHKCVKKLFPKKDDCDKQAVIINISSIASQVVVPLFFYSISKACLSELSRQIGLVSRDTNVFSVTISPGPVLTDDRPHHQAMSKYTLMNRVATTQEISDFVMYVTGHAQLFNGQELNIDGGYVAKLKQPSTLSFPQSATSAE